jgi:hypothetical protein
MDNRLLFLLSALLSPAALLQITGRFSFNGKDVAGSSEAVTSLNLEQPY